MADLVRHEPGVYLNQRMSDYLRDYGLGSSALKDLLQEPAEWWWSSPFNTISPRTTDEKEAAHFRIGTATHVALLEGMEVFNTIYGLRPGKADYPDALDTKDELSAECQARGLPKSGTKEQLVDRLINAGATCELLPVIQREFDRSGKTPLSRSEMSTIMLLHQQAMSNPNELATVAGGSVRLSDAFRGGLSEVSVYWDDENGIPMRARFDKLHPNSTIDVKTFSNWSKANFGKALLVEIVRRGYLLQAAHYEEGRRQLRRFVREGRVFGGTEQQREILKEIAASEAWAWIWVFAKTVGAPLVKGVRLNMAGLRFNGAVGERDAALANFLAYREFHGLEPGKMWFDPADAIWEPEDEDYPAFAMTGD